MLPLSAPYLKRASSQFDLEDVTHLRLAGLGITSLSVASSELFRCTSLVTLSLRKNEIRALDGIDALPSLESLDLTDNRVSALAPLAGCASLRELLLANNCITDMKELSHLTGLQLLRTLALGPGRGNTITSGDRHVAPAVEMLPRLLVLDGQLVQVWKVCSVHPGSGGDGDGDWGGEGHPHAWPR